MSKPYLQRRGDTYAFRIAVPADLRPYLGVREFTRTLRTPDRRLAAPYALYLASKALHLFMRLRAMPDKKEGLSIGYIFEIDLDEFRSPKRIKVQAEPHEQDAVNSAIKTALEHAPAHSQREEHPTPTSTVESSLEALKTTAKLAPKPKKRELHKLSEVIPEWRRLKNPAISTVEIYTAAINRFEEHFAELFAETIEPRHIRENIKWLESEKLSPKSIDKEHGAIRALLTIAENEEWISSNPAKGVMLPAMKGKKVRSYTPEECKGIFSSPVFKDGERPIAGKGEAAYWIPLLMLFTGARREEVCQLTAERIKESEGISYLLINPIDDDGRLKTEESKRAIPIHNQLQKMGFLTFVENQLEGGGGQLFPLLKSNKRGQYGAKWGDWWARYLRQTIGITDDRISPAHSFRHLFVTECRRLNFREDYARALVGHAGGSRKDSHDDYGEHLITSLAAEMNRIDFRGLDLSHLYKIGVSGEKI